MAQYVVSSGDIVKDNSSLELNRHLFMYETGVSFFCVVFPQILTACDVNMCLRSQVLAAVN